MVELVDVEEGARPDVVVHVDVAAVDEDGVVLVDGEQRHRGVLQHDVGVAVPLVSAKEWKWLSLLQLNFVRRIGNKFTGFGDYAPMNSKIFTNPGAKVSCTLFMCAFNL